MSLAKQIETMLDETEAMLDKVAGDRLRNVFVSVPMGGRWPPHSAMREWLKDAGLNLTGDLTSSFHRLAKPVVLVNAPGFDGALPAGWLFIDAPLFSGRSEHWMHADVNKAYRQWVQQ